MQDKAQTKAAKIKLSPGELELLEILWSCGALTIAEVHQEFHNRNRQISYPTVQTRLNRLVEKEIIRKNGQYPALYEARLQQSGVTGRYSDLFDILCGGSIAPLMLHLAEKRDLKPAELEVLKKIIADHEKERKQ
ncbi:MAG: BlaI/MecI/CopY family transcriptional regulator [Planctomycetaceae bacterium]|nr:BlaI/MecI/CopY family transcriptional regulator [Planctomycetaceae bacterium]